MPTTVIQRTMARAKPLSRVDPHKVIVAPDFTPGPSWSVTPLSTEPNWHAALSVDIDVDPGVVGQLRIRLSTGVTSATVSVAAPTKRLLLGWTAIPNATVRVFLEGRVSAGAGGIRIVRATPIIMSYPPGFTGTNPASITTGGYVTPTWQTTHNIATTAINPGAGTEAILFAISAPGPSDAATITYTHPSGSIIVDDGGEFFRPRLLLVLVQYTGQSTFAFTATSNIRVAAIPLDNVGSVTAGPVAHNTTPVDPAGVANSANNLGLTITTLNWTGGSVTAPPAGHTTLVNSPLGGNQIHVATQALATAGTYNPNAATVGPGNEQGTAVAVTVSPTATVAPAAYMWENRPAYVEPNPTAAVGSPERTLATSLGLTSRVNVSNLAEFNAATTTATPGTQIYFTQSITGNGTSSMLNWIGTNTPVAGAGTASSGTAANPILWTCAPNVWLDGGLAPGSSNQNSRTIQIRGALHVGMYGCNVRNAHFPVKFDQCSGTAAAPIIFRYNKVMNGGDALVHFGGYFTIVSGRYGETNYVDARYNELWNAGLANNRFGEAFYIGVGVATSNTASVGHHIDILGNYIHNVPAEALDAKSGCHHVKFNYNLVADCGDTQVRTGDAANQGFPGSVQLQPGGLYGNLAGFVNDSEVIGNRFVRCSSAAAKFPPAQILVCARGVKVIGNAFEQCTIPGAAQIRIYVAMNNGSTTGTPTFGNTGTFEIHNNTSKDARVLWDIQVAGGTSATELANATNNTNASNNVGTSAQTGVNLVVTPAAFTNDGSGNEGAGFAVAAGGALDVAGANTSGLWTVDFAGTTTAAPVNPGARQR